MKKPIKTQKDIHFGFTLIELMIVVAIVGTLASVAFPLYSDYQASSKLTSGLAEISSGKIQFEILLNNGQTPSNTLMTSLETTTNTQNCNIEVDASTIRCTILNAPSQVNGAILTWSRDAETSEWSCTSSNISGAASLAPKTCPI